MKVRGTQTKAIEIDIDHKELAGILMNFILNDWLDIHEYDDAGCDWFTDGDRVYVGGKDWFFINDESIATLINAMNIIQYGKKLTLDKGE
jgi:hypothetical protein